MVKRYGHSIGNSWKTHSHRKLPVLVLTIFLSPLPQYPDLRFRGYVVDISIGTVLHNSEFLLVILVCSGLYLLQGGFFLMMSNN